jgi:hypothetical protein
VSVIGEERCVFVVPAKKRSMLLLVVKATSDCRKKVKGKWAIKHDVPVITYELLLDDYLDEDEDEDDSDES